MKEKVIITTVGTSIFANYRSKETRNKVEDYVPIDSYWESVFSKGKIDRPATDVYDRHVEIQWKYIEKIVKSNWFYLDDQPNEYASAEISSIIEIKIKIAEKQPCKVHLLTTDTLESVFAALLIRDWFKEFKSKYGIEVLFQLPGAEFKEQKQSNFVIKSLKVTDSSSYQDGFQNLFYVLRELTTSKEYKGKSVFNITGGYKAIIPAMVLFAQIEDIPFFYLYHPESLEREKKSDLIDWQKLPFGFDYAAWEILEDYISSEELRKKIGHASRNKHPALQILEEYKVIDLETLKLTHIGTLLEAYLREKTNMGKSMFGFVAELLVLEYFVKEGKKVRRGDVLNPQKKAFGNYQKGDPLEVDIVIERDDGTEEWCELKPGTKKKIVEGVDQLLKRLVFNREVLKRKVARVCLILYVPEFFDSEQYRTQIKGAIEKMQDFPDVEFIISYFEVPFDKGDIRSPSKMAITQQGVNKLPELDLNEFK